MRVLLDECLPKKLKRKLPGHEATTVPERGWAGIKNGTLLRLAEAEFDVFLTTDRNLQFQQNLAVLNLAVIVLAAPNTKLSSLEPLMDEVEQTLAAIVPGAVITVSV